jgi:hypothetical protein
MDWLAGSSAGTGPTARAAPALAGSGIFPPGPGPAAAETATVTARNGCGSRNNHYAAACPASPDRADGLAGRQFLRDRPDGQCRPGTGRQWQPGPGPLLGGLGVTVTVTQCGPARAGATAAMSSGTGRRPKWTRDSDCSVSLSA